MRTTVTLDPEVESLLRRAVRRSGKSFKEVLNRAVREGLAPSESAGQRKPFRVRARPMGLRSGLDPTALNHLIDDLEISAFVRRQRRRK